jgi:hypothetical protein
MDAANWQTPQELPDLRHAGIVALDTETRDEGLHTTSDTPSPATTPAQLRRFWTRSSTHCR